LPSSSSLPSVTAKHVVIADHAGSGKTLAYLLPFISALKEEEDLLGSAATQPNCPRLIVVAPTTELCAQVVRVCRALSRGGAPFRSIAATGGYPLKTHKDALSDGVDVLVATPGRLRMLMEAGVLHFHHCRGIVFDEVDILLGEASAFAEQVLPVCKAANPDTTKLVFVSATLPENIFVDLEMEFPGLQSAIGPGLHRNPPNIIEQLVDCSGGDEVTEESGRRRKMAALYAVLQEQKAPRTIVFCNKIETCRTVENFLNRTFPRESNTMVLPHHAAISDQRREQNLATFLQPPPPSSSGDRFQRQPTNNNQDSSPNMILVCTDRASRGVDSAYVTHVVLFDFPRDPSEYVRRVGRTARGAGGEGLVSVLVLGRQVSLAQAIISKNLKGQPIHKVPISLGTGTGTGGGGGGGGVGGNIGGNNNNNSGNSVSTAQGQTMSDDAVRFWKDIKELGGGKDGEEEEEEEDDDDRDSGDYNGRE
jgi:ATP-dependent RNA helicase DDX18/HAS1